MSSKRQGKSIKFPHFKKKSSRRNPNPNTKLATKKKILKTIIKMTEIIEFPFEKKIEKLAKP
jgi:hypothetical protein